MNSINKNREVLHYWIFQGLFIVGYMFHHTEEWDSRFLALFSLATLFIFVAVPKISQWAFLLLLIVCSISNLIKFPNLANHSNITLFVGLFLLPYQFTLIFKPDKVNYAQINRALRGITICLYFFTVFHKMNWDFLNPDVSCANVKLQDYFSYIPDTYTSLKSSLKNVMPYLGLLMEGTVPILLFFSKTRSLGILNIVVLHFILAPMGFTDFSSFAMALAWCFVDIKKMKIETLRKDFTYLILSILALASLLGLTRYEKQIETYEFAEGFFFALLYSPFLYIHLKGRIDRTRIQFPQKIYPALFVILFFLFGFNSYLGLRTAGNFSMFSNLVTEGEKSNHILLSSNPFKFFTLQDDNIEIIEVDPLISGFYRRMPDVEQKIPRIEFSRILDFIRNAKYKNIQMTIRYKGHLRTTRTAGFDPNFDLDAPYWQKKLFKFRHIQSIGGPQECLW